MVSIDLYSQGRQDKGFAFVPMPAPVCACAFLLLRKAKSEELEKRDTQEVGTCWGVNINVFWQKLRRRGERYL